MDRRGTIRVFLLPGLGNKLFQYVFARLLAEHHGMKLKHDGIKEFGIKKPKCKGDKNLPTIRFKAREKREKDWWSIWNNKNFFKNNYKIYGYFEDYLFYKPHLSKIRSWFKETSITNYEDVVFHLRIGDRLFDKNFIESTVNPGRCFDVFKKIRYRKIVIVTDLKQWDIINESDLGNLKKLCHSSKTINKDRIILNIRYANQIIKSLSSLNPIIHSKSDSTIEDFNYIRSFDKIVFTNSTFAWWAATLSKASSIGVYEYWRKYKGDDRNKNLGLTDYPGWYSWK